MDLKLTQVFRDELLNVVGEWSRSLIRQRKTLQAAVASTALVIGTASADDTEVFFSDDRPPPNVMFIVDVSGSMNWTDVTPLPNIAGNVLWLDANDRATILDSRGRSASSRRFSGNVARWRDKSGHRHDLVGTSATLDNINRRTSVRFTNDIMTGPDIFDGSMTEATFFFIQQENAGSNNFFLNFNGNNRGPTGRISFHTPWNSNRGWYWDAGNRNRGDRTEIGGRPTNIGDITQVTAWKSVAANKNGMSLNNGAFTAESRLGNAARSTGGMYFGQGARDHELAEIIVYDRKLSESEIKQVQEYLDKNGAPDWTA